MNSLAYIFLGVYMLAMVGILLYCLLQLSLAIIYLQKSKQSQTLEKANPTSQTLPYVTVQLPLYNEYYVVERLLNAVASLQYPKDRFEIQVLDDSTDDTTALIQSLLPDLQNNGLQISLQQRKDRSGYKAGALAAGLTNAKGSHIAIFDADFIPAPDFLLRTIPYFTDPKVGVVQTRWQHINKDYSLLTRIQAFALDVHFSIEQKGRNKKGYFINFNGTAGIWRKEAIEDAGGWSADTLTEDLDLSYRAQLKGWRFIYLEEVGSPAELPVAIQGYKSQQFRWNKGGAETARKIIPSILRSGASWKTKLHGLAHLLNSSVYICISTSVVLSVPLLWFMENFFSRELYDYLSIFLLATFSTAVVFFIALFSSTYHHSRLYLFLYYLFLFPSFIAINLGLSFHNAMAVLRGYLGEKTPFIRTPKFNVTAKDSSRQKNKYLQSQLDWTTWVEGLLILYFIAGIYLAFQYENYGMLPVHALSTLGFSYIFFSSISQAVVSPKHER